MHRNWLDSKRLVLGVLLYKQEAGKIISGVEICMLDAILEAHLGCWDYPEVQICCSVPAVKTKEVQRG